MSEKLYNLEFSGQIIPGWDIDEVKTNLAKLLKANEEKIYKLFSGDRFLIKKNVDHQTVLKINNILKGAGADCKITEVPGSADTVPPPLPSQPQPDAADQPPDATAKPPLAPADIQPTRFFYLIAALLFLVPMIACGAEIFNAFKSQQHRWAKGSIQTAKKNLGNLFRSDIGLLVKIQAFLHLTHYMVHPMMLLVVLTSIPMLYSQWFFNHLSFPIMIFTLLCLATLGPSSMYMFSQKILYRDWVTRIKFLPLLMCLGTGIAANNTKAVLEALLNVESGFVRTPKYGISKRADRWDGKRYWIPLNAVSILEFFLGVYSLAGLLMFLLFSKYLVSPFLLIYTSGFFYVFFLSLKHGFPCRWLKRWIDAGKH